MVTSERYINHEFDRLEIIIRQCAQSGKLDLADEIVGDLNMIMLDRKATGERLIQRSVRILESREVPVEIINMINLQEAYKLLQKRIG
ncbi:hypothetical protein LZG74_25620 [Dyadobacter sp. CY327]|uniref:hypothetical protein n=1 Tax=Dyadobacter sp. CY327 TaxID=2907301 RepID=UPI001F1B2218|nr:hypothetical protein [Dyadobacter sp. CY327]MCE7073713.1 hypothetical protein [Dyadobacter sp. CY327]